MKKIIYLSYAAVICWLMTGCVRDAKNVTLPQSEAKLVVTAFISPDDTVLFVEITKSRPVLGQQDAYGLNNAVRDAQVIISDGSQSLTLTFDETLQQYTYPLQANPNFVKAGATYFLSATTPDGKSVSATTTVPVNKIDAATAMITFKEYKDDNYTSNSIDFSFFDIPNEENYYRVEAYIIYKQDLREEGTSKVYFNDSREGSQFNLYSDKNKDGKEFSAVKGIYFNPSSFAIPQQLFVNVYSTSKEYYDYHKSVGSFQGDNPFSEPTLIYSNIKNGLGVFAGYTTTVVSKPIPNPVLN